MSNASSGVARVCAGTAAAAGFLGSGARAEVTGVGIAKDRLRLEFITIHFEARTARLTALGAWQVSDVEQGGASAKR